MANSDFNRLPKSRKLHARSSHVLGIGGSSDPSVGIPLKEQTGGAVGTNGDLAAIRSHHSSSNPEPEFAMCGMFCLLDVPSSDLKVLWGDILKAKIAAYHLSGCDEETARQNGFTDYLEDTKSVAKFLKFLAVLIADGNIEIKTVGLPGWKKGDMSKSISDKIKLDVSRFPVIITIRNRIIQLLTKRIAVDVLESLFKKFLIGYNLLDTMATVNKFTQCAAKCTAAEARRVAKDLLATAKEVADSIDAVLTGFFDWLANEIDKAFSKARKRIKTSDWKYAALLPATAKQKISKIHADFSFLGILPPSLGSMKMICNQTLTEHQVSTQTLRTVAQGVLEALYFDANAGPGVGPTDTEIHALAKSIGAMSPLDFAGYLEDKLLITIPSAS